MSVVRSNVSAFEALPAELLDMVVTVVRNESTRSFLHLLLCSRQLLEAGRPILYRDVVLTSRTIEASLGRFLVKHLSAVRTITISIDGKVEWLLLQALQRCTRLKTVSFTILRATDRHESHQVCPTEELFVHALLHHLPPTVTSLNLDIAGYVGFNCLLSRSAERRILRQLPRQLDHLRLRLGHLSAEDVPIQIPRFHGALSCLHVDTYVDIVEALPRCLGGEIYSMNLRRFTSTNLQDNGMEFFPSSRPSRPAFVDHISGLRITMIQLPVRVFVCGRSSINIAPQHSLILDGLEPGVLVPQEMRIVLSAFAGWYKTSSGALLPGFHETYEYDPWIGQSLECLDISCNSQAGWYKIDRFGLVDVSRFYDSSKSREGG